MFTHKRFILITLSLICILLFTLNAVASNNSEPTSQHELEPAEALGTGFTYQGLLKDAAGHPISDTCDFRFSLWDSLEGTTQIGATDEVLGVTVLAGYFTTEVNAGNEFGSNAFNGEARWLKVEVKCASEVEYSRLSPFQPISMAPYSSYAMTAPWSGITNMPDGFSDGVDDVASGGGDITSVIAHYGLFGGGDSGDVVIGITNTYRLPQLCSDGQVAKWSGGSLLWGCAVDLDTNNHGLLSGLNDDDHPQYFHLSQDETVSGKPTFSNAMVPFTVTSSTKVNNLNADLLDGYHAGNGNGQIPVNNGILNNNLNAELLEGHTSANFASSVHNHWGQNWSGSGAGLSLNGGIGGLSASGSAYGIAADTSSGKAVYGHATGVSGANYGVYGWSESPDGYAGYFNNEGGGVALVANSKTYTGTVFNILSNNYLVFSVKGDGNVYADGSYYGAGGVYIGNADFAEMVLPGQTELEAGDVLVIDLDGQMIRSSKPYQTNVAGVYSQEPGFIGGNKLDESGNPLEPERIPLAIVGIVTVKASAVNSAIKPGDLLTTSAIPGHAMRAGDNPPIGSVLGKALQGLKSGTGLIQVLVTLQ